MAIKRSDIEQGDVFGGLTESAKKAKEEVRLLETMLSSIKASAKKIKSSLTGFEPKDSKSIRDHNTLVKDSNTLALNRLKIDKQLEQNKKAKIQTQQAELRLTEQQKRADERAAKAAQKSATETKKQNSAFVQLNAKIRQLSATYKDLLVQEGRETRETRRLQKEILKLNAIRNKANENLGQHQHKVGQYGKAIIKLRNLLGQLGLAFGVFRLLRSSIGVIVDFDKAVSDLGAISGKTESELEPLTDQAKELGATSQFTASEITGLQIELAKLGFTVDQIVDSTGPISKFATATGSEIPEAAALAGSALRAFGLDASEMERVVSVLGVATTKTGLDFGFLQTAMSTIAPVANAFGFSIEDTTALLGQLANSGFDASSAATATRNILLNLADANGELAKELGRPITSADDLAVALQELQDKGVNLAEALELTDKRSVAAFETFLNGAGTLVELRDSITGVSGELDEMSAKRLDSIAGATDLLKSAWEGLILEWSEAKNAGGKLKGVITFLADNLKLIVKVVLGGLRAWALQRIALKLFRTEITATGRAVSVGLIPSIYKSITALRASAKAFRAGTIGVKGFGAALKKIPFVAILSGLFTIIDLFRSVGDEAEEAGEEIEQLKLESTGLNRVNEETEKRLNIEAASLTNVFDKLKATTKGTKERKQALDELNKDYGITLKNLSDEGEFVRQLDVAYKNLIARMEQKIRFQLVEEEINKLLLRRIELENRIEDQQFARQRSAEEKLKGQQRALEIEKEISELESNRIFTGDPTLDQQENKSQENKISGLKEELAVLNDLNSLKDTELESVDVVNQRIKKLRDSLSELNLTDFNENATDTTGDAERDKLKELNEFKKKQAIEYAKFENDLLQDKDTSPEAREFVLSQKRLEIARDTADKIVELNFKEKDELIKQQNAYLKAVEKAELDRIKVNDEANKEIEDNTESLLVDAFKKLQEMRKKAEDRELKELKERATEREDIIKASTDKILEFSDKRIDKINDEMTAAQKQSDFFAQLAAEGNIDAEQSLAKQNDIQREAEREKAEIERRKRQVEIASTVITAYSNALGEGKDAPQALQEAILGTTSLSAYIGALPAFLDGIEDTGTNGRGIDGKGGFHAILHPNERVLTKEQNAMIGDYSNQEVANIMYGYKNESVDTFVQPYQSVIDLSVLEKKMDGIEKAIKDKPVPSLELGQVTSSYMEIIENKTKGNRITQNRFKVS